MTPKRSGAQHAVRTGSHAFLDAMEESGVELLFNLPGTQTLGLLSLLAERGRPRPIFVRHEQAAAFGAVGYGKLTGRPAICMTVPGPGATNLITGVTSALADGIPLVVATPQVPNELIGRGVVHDADVEGLFRAATKAQLLVDRVDDLGPALIEAVELALEPRAGPVQVLFPTSLFATATSWLPSPGGPRPVPFAPVVTEVAAALARAERPIFYIGDRVRLSGADTLLVALAERLGAPVATDEGARGTIRENHPLSLGSVSFRLIDDVLVRGDLCLAVGTTFPEWSTGSWRLPLPRPLVHVHDEASAFDVNYPADVKLAGDIPGILDRLLKGAAALGPRRSWALQAVREMRQAGTEALLAERARYASGEGHGLHPVDVVRALREGLRSDAVVCVDGSATAAWMNEQSFPVLDGGALIQPEVFRELGSALMMGIGCRLADSARDVVVVQGDGGLLFQLGELSSLVHNEIKLVIVVFEDGYYNGDRIFQEHLFGGRTSDCMLFNPDFVQLTNAFGLPAYRAVTVEQLRAALERSLADEQSSLIAVAVDPLPAPYRLHARIEEWKQRLAGLDAGGDG